MKILHVYKDYFPVVGGIENHIQWLCRELAKQKEFQVQVLATNVGSRTVRERWEGVEVIKAGRQWTVARTPISWQLFREMARLRPDIAHLHFPYPMGELAFLLFGRARRLVITYHSDVVRQQGWLRLYQPFVWRILARADRLVATSPNYIRSSPYLRRFAEKCTVVPSAIDPARFQKRDEAQVSLLRQRYGEPIVLFVGKLRYYKGLEYLIEAMEQVPARLLIVGSGPMEGSLRQETSRRGLSHRVFFLGEATDAELPAYYHACDLFVLPASHRSEALGLAQMEAMACGKPVVCTEVGTGTSYVNLHQVTGLVVEPRRPDALSMAINRLLTDTEMRKRLGQAALERVRTQFALDHMVARISELYRQLLA